MYQMSQTTDFAVFYPYVLGYMIAYMPTLALVNSVAFRQMNNPSKDFGWIRVFGTVGWIVAGFIISLLGWDSQSGIQEGLLSNTFTMTAIASAFLGVFSFLLPKTPPIKSDENQSILEKTGLSSVTMLKNKNFLIFFISSILICRIPVPTLDSLSHGLPRKV